MSTTSIYPPVNSTPMDVATPMPSGPLSVKVQYGQDVRRFPLDSLSFEDLANKIRYCYSLPDTSFVIRYLDDDKDWISMSSDQELGISTSFGNPIRLFVSGPNGELPPPIAEEKIDPKDIAPPSFEMSCCSTPPSYSPVACPFGSLKDNKVRAKMEMKAAKREFKQAVKSACRDAKLSRKEFKVARKELHHIKKHGARLVSDNTVPSQSRFYTGEQFMKVWRLRNESPVPWPADLLLVFKKGCPMGSVSSIMLGKNVMPNEEVEVSVPMIAPHEPGTHSCVWRLFSNQVGKGRFFGEPLRVKIAVYPASQLSQ